uniref:Uncharacterized protein n=1 Tax=Fagus sylvatica TaxID=28930 RepID=A0A2N9G6V5_FAGSY
MEDGDASKFQASGDAVWRGYSPVVHLRLRKTTLHSRATSASAIEILAPIKQRNHW